MNLGPYVCQAITLSLRHTESPLSCLGDSVQVLRGRQEGSQTVLTSEMLFWASHQPEHGALHVKAMEPFHGSSWWQLRGLQSGLPLQSAPYSELCLSSVLGGGSSARWKSWLRSAAGARRGYFYMRGYKQHTSFMAAPESTRLLPQGSSQTPGVCNIKVNTTKEFNVTLSLAPLWGSGTLQLSWGTERYAWEHRMSPWHR